MIYSVSYVMGPDDNGHCVSYADDWRSASGCFRELIRDGATAVILWIGAWDVLARFNVKEGVREYGRGLAA